MLPSKATERTWWSDNHSANWSPGMDDFFGVVDSASSTSLETSCKTKNKNATHDFKYRIHIYERNIQGSFYMQDKLRRTNLLP